MARQITAFSNSTVKLLRSLRDKKARRTSGLFLAEGLTEASAETEHDEFVEPFRLPLSDAVAMAQRGEILDAKSAIALLRAGAEVGARSA